MFFQKLKNYKCQNLFNIAKIKSQEAERAQTLHLRHWRIRSRAGIMHAEVLHLKTGLQDTSLQSQEGARNLALPDSASARKY